MGLQVSQVRLFIERFPTEFRLMALGRVVLPMKDGKPYVSEDGLPCPLLSTFNALKYLATRIGDQGIQWNAMASSQLRRVMEEGVQVEWMELDSFLSWQVMCDQADAQTQVQVQPHILDTAMKYVHYLRASFPSEEAGEDTILVAGTREARGFENLFQGKGVHRFQEARQLLQTSDIGALTQLAEWRKRVHYLHANALAQQYFVGAPDWAELKGHTLDFDGVSHSLQTLVVSHVTSTICSAEILATTQETPRLKRSSMNMNTFKEICDLVKFASQYMRHLQQKYHMVWPNVVSAARLFKRVLLNGEVGLRQTFTRAMSCANRVDRIDFEKTDPGCDFALVIDKLQTAQAEFAGAGAAAKLAEPEARMDGAKGSQESDLASTQDPAPVAQQSSTSPPASCAEGEAPAVSQSDDQTKPSSQEDQDLLCMLQTASMIVDETLTLYDQPWKKGDPAPPALAATQGARLFVCPSPAGSRCRPLRGVQALKSSEFLEVLAFFKDGDAVLIGLGHDPEQAAAVRAKLNSLSPAFQACVWTTMPVMQSGQTAYVEYYLFGRSASWQGGTGASWIGPVPAQLEKKARLVRCDAHEHVQERAEHGQDLCDVCGRMSHRYVSRLPIADNRKGSSHDAECDLLGGDTGMPAQGDDDESSVSEDENAPAPCSADGVGRPETATEQEVNSAGKAWGIKVGRQGMTCAGWKNVLEAVSPKMLVLAGPICFQAGLLWAFLEYNDARSMLGGCSMVAFSHDAGERRALGMRQISGRSQEKKLQSYHIGMHTLDRALHAYADTRSQAARKTASRVTKGPGATSVYKMLTRHPSDQAATLAAADKPESGEVVTVNLSNFITLFGDNGDTPTATWDAVAPADEDSDDAGGHGSENMTREVLSVRNSRFMEKHRVQVGASPNAPKGQGLFAKEKLAVGTVIPAKGPWFHGIAETQKWLGSVSPAATRDMLVDRVVQVSIAGGQGSNIYKVLTGPVGYANHFRCIDRRPNCRLEWRGEGKGLGEHSLMMRVAAEVKAGKELLLDFGTSHSVGRKRAPGPKGGKLRGIKRARGAGKSAAKGAAV